MRRSPSQIRPAAPVFPFVLDLVSCRPVSSHLSSPLDSDKLLAMVSIIRLVFWSLKGPEEPSNQNHGGQKIRSTVDEKNKTMMVNQTKKVEEVL